MKLLILIFMILFPPAISASAEIDEPEINMEEMPFSEIVDWRYKEQRQKYDELLSEKYFIKDYSIFYCENNKIKMEDPWYTGEKLTILYGCDGKEYGYILTIKNITVPILFYKQSVNDDKPRLVYSRTHSFEIIADRTGKMIKLISFEVESIGGLKKFIGESLGYKVQEERGIFKKNPQKDYYYCASLIEMLKFLTKHFETLIKESLSPTNTDTDNNQIVLGANERLKQYEDIKSQIKAEVEKYGGDNWEKTMQDIQKKWPTFGR